MKTPAVLFLASISIALRQSNDYSKTPKDKPVHVEGSEQMTSLDRAIQPYAAKGHTTYPAAKKRFLAGLPPKYSFSLTIKLWNHSHTKFEVVFVAIDHIKNSTVSGHLATHTVQDVGYHFGDHISFPESQVIDWTIVRPDGTEEGNVVGKFLDTYKPH